MSSTADFRLSITRALGDQLADSIAALTPTPLVFDAVAALDPRGGVYELFYRGDLVYIGKADTSLRERLADHRRKISGRVGLSLADVAFVALYVDEDLSAVAPETLLINRHRVIGESPWNTNGFGNKDPGRERDTSAVKSSHFDALYPANLSLTCDWISAGRHRLADLLRDLKANLPYVFRYEAGNKAISKQPPVYLHTEIAIAQDSPSVSEVFAAIADQTPGWQVTAFPGYVIMYREGRGYSSAQKIYAATID
jgi:hypothetical protein